MIAQFCPQCGAMLDPKNKFCIRCGACVADLFADSPYEPPKVKSAEKLEDTAKTTEIVREERRPEPRENRHKMKTRKAGARKAFTAVISVILCVLMVIAMLGSVLLLDIRSLAQEQTLYTILSRVDLSRIPAADIVGGSASAYESLDDYLCRAINGSVDREAYDWQDLKPKTIRVLLEDTNLLELVSEKAAAMVQDLLEGSSRAEIEEEDIEKFLYENRKVLDKYFDLVTFDREGCAALADMAGENVDLSMISVDYLEDELPGVYSTVRTVTSWLLLIGQIALAVVFLAVIIVVNRRSILAGVKDVCVSFMALGGILLLASGVTYLLPELLAGEYGIGYLVTVVLSEVLLSGIWINVGIFGAGLLGLIVCLIIFAVRRRKAA